MTTRVAPALVTAVLALGVVGCGGGGSNHEWVFGRSSAAAQAVADRAASIHSYCVDRLAGGAPSSSVSADVHELVATYRAEPRVPQPDRGRNLLRPIVQRVRDELATCAPALAAVIDAALAGT